MTALLETLALSKTFTLHGRGGQQLPVFANIDLSVQPGECLALTGHSGSGKSSLLRCLYGNYGASSGDVRVRHEGRWVNMTSAAPREVFEVRRRTLGYVSQFLRVIPRVSTIDIVADPLRRMGVAAESAREQAAQWLTRLNLQPHLWSLPPATFSGGEQQRVNIAHGMITAPPVLLLDEPTASLDADNRRVVVELIRAARAQGSAIVGIFHDDEVREAVATRRFDVEQYRKPI
ncbi:phosphonate C-P lyase system protein PhnL [Rhodoferax antarcticus]|uniref:Phosphonate C-P lyase system protein n=1 Tax=Rhodoferax antarcticus ANT.BR TaxID=1111071 RepID=A0A1Q8YJJ8_9BURK|nr:phosphonate C-P lyase system protein PhnL [Rhodoferax antarcticus]APW47699.1 phosphonate C-P lyase system protein PhnL [Rhodoferax antarcticus]MCW2312518.1 alpha-D-ribose 1-methylphosphonate 5-triphosphate synthase subunit PhnL [Rhodoferax antarcticus]OLP08228.1 phosphonate C-P lyase system protein [Rhodoferax antarcticus ANT.BR]